MTGKGIVTPGDIEIQGIAGTREETQETSVIPETLEVWTGRENAKGTETVTTGATLVRTPEILVRLVQDSNKTKTLEVVSTAWSC